MTLFLPLVENFGDPSLSEIFSADALAAAFLRVEQALAEAEAECGVIPATAADAIASVRPSALDADEMWMSAQRVGYPIVSVVQQIARAAGPEGEGFVHWGATTQDIMDTALVLQLREAHGRFQALLERVCDAAADLTEAHASTLISARTHGQRAVPTTFGAKTAVWLDEYARHLRRLEAAADEAFLVQLGGAGGTLATLGASARAVREKLAEVLGLRAGEGVWHVARDRVAAYGSVLAAICATSRKVAREIADLARSEVGELEESYSPLRGASSTMPQKRNPVVAEAIIGLAGLGMAISPALHQAMCGGHERATGEWQIEWDAIPLLWATSAGALARLAEELETLTVRTDVMRANVESDTTIMSEALMIHLAAKIGRQAAHESVYDLVQSARDERVPLASALAGSKLAGYFVDVDLGTLLRPENYLGEAPDHAASAVARWRAPGAVSSRATRQAAAAIAHSPRSTAASRTRA